MRIRKAYQGTVPENKILDTYSTSQTDTYSCNFVNGINAYSTSEVNTGTKWIDGKPIYRKVATGGSVSGGGRLRVDPQISNIDKMLCTRGFCYETNGNWFELSRANPNSGAYQITYYFKWDEKQFEIETGSSMNLSSVVIICEYTKTTD